MTTNRISFSSFAGDPFKPRILLPIDTSKDAVKERMLQLTRANSEELEKRIETDKENTKKKIYKVLTPIAFTKDNTPLTYGAERYMAQIKAYNGTGNIRYSYLTTFQDWVSAAVYMEWGGRTQQDMLSTDELIAYRFFAAFRKWSQNNVEKDKRADLIREVFPIEQVPWKYFSTLQDWKNYMEEKAWEGKKAEDLYMDRKSGASAFYNAFLAWTATQPNPTQLRHELFPNVVVVSKPKPGPKRISREVFSTIEEWKSYLVEKGWSGLSSYEMMRHEDIEARSFYKRFYQWTKDKESAAELRESLFRGGNHRTREFARNRNTVDQEGFTKYQSWKNFVAFDDWAQFHESHGWKGRSSKEMQESKDDGGYAFYAAFMNWVKKQPQEKQEAYRRALFPNDIISWKNLKTFEMWENIAKELGVYHKAPKYARDTSKALGINFYDSFLNWTQSQPHGEELCKKMYSYTKPKVKRRHVTSFGSK